MNKKKSLGSSPIGYSSLGDNSYHFIRDLGVSPQNELVQSDSVSSATAGYFESNDHKNQGNGSDSDQGGNEKTEKKIVSYYLELELIDRLKNLADDQGSFYSSVVSKAIEAWVEYHGY